MKIAHLMSHDSLNGVATSTKALIDAQIMAGHQLMLVHPAGSWIEKQTFAGPVKMMTSSFRPTPRDLRRTGYPIRDWGRTLVHAHGSRANKFLMIFTLADGAPAVMTAHARQFQLPWMFAHAVIGLSRQTASYYTSRLIVPKRKMHIVPNLFDAAALEPVSAASRGRARAALGLREGSFVIASVGAIMWRKRQVDAVRVLRDLVASGVDAELLLVGGLPEEAEIMPGWQQALGDPLVAGRVHLAGHRNDAVALLPAADVYLCASKVEEAPIAPLEAMAQAIPVISTDVGNMADLLPPDRIFPVGDIAGMAQAAKLLASNAELRRSEGESCRATVSGDLAPGRILPRIEAVYRTALASARDRGQKYFQNPEDRWRPEPAD